LPLSLRFRAENICSCRFAFATENICRCRFAFATIKTLLKEDKKVAFKATFLHRTFNAHLSIPRWYTVKPPSG